ncbi:hypothetical protein SLS56_011290 [Neofusicoccum ribis]|uniref:Uncharacterized protein n=1 Tax=Neofusicoccum ribis TaxID=45134 RepID=A0ABR3SC26_9PEZI
MDYSRFTIPKEVQDIEEEFRSNPNAKRPRKLGPHVVFPAVVSITAVERDKRERAAAAAAAKKQAAADSVPNGSTYMPHPAPVSTTPANSPPPRHAASSFVAPAASSGLYAEYEHIVSSAIDILKNEAIPQQIRDNLRAMVRDQIFPDYVPAASPGLPALSIPNDDDIPPHLLRSLQGIARRHRQLPAPSSRNQAENNTAVDDLYLMTGAIQRFPSDPPLSPRSPSPTTINSYYSSSSSFSPSPPPSETNNNTTTNPASDLTTRLTAAGIPPLPRHPTAPTRPSTTLPTLHLPDRPLADVTATPSARIGPRADSWTHAEALAAAAVLSRIFLEHAGAQRLRADDKYRLAAEMLAANYGVRRTWGSVKNWWFREGRRVTGLDERVVVRERAGAAEARAEGQRRRRVGERERGMGMEGRKRAREE